MAVILSFYSRNRLFAMIESRRVVDHERALIINHLRVDLLESEAKNLLLFRANELRDSSSPSAPQNDTLSGFSGSLLDRLTAISIHQCPASAHGGLVL
ncbi:MAG: hypothetical protein ACRDHZ_08195, partial [Ktedonobacteraceae bacterium]